VSRVPLAVHMKGICKTFDGVQALDGVDFAVEREEIHALLGGNGAGKSTILKILNGVYRPDQGSIEIDGVPLTEHTPSASHAAGIAMNYQELSLVPTLSVAQNIFLTREARGRELLIDDEALVHQAREIFSLLGVRVDPEALVGELGAGQRQLTEIAKTIAHKSKILVLDEPSTALAVVDVERLFEFLRRLKRAGVSIIYVSHRMNEIEQIADRATILCNGRHVITAPLDDLPIDTMIEHIVGKRSRGFHDVKRAKTQQGEALLELRQLSGRHKPKDVCLTLHRGEVLGVAGLLGAGRSSLARLVAGIDVAVAGEIYIKGRHVTFNKPEDAIAAGVALIPEARATQGLIPDHSVMMNMTMASIKQLCRGGLVRTDMARQLTDQQIERLSIKTASHNHAVSTLSGGNQQKVVIGKWLASDPDILVLDEPTAGIDIGSKSEILQLIADFAAAGKGVMIISSELSELLTICSRVVVMADGRLYQDFSRDRLDDQSCKNAAPVQQLQAAEKRLQIEIQNALRETTKREREIYDA